MEPLTQALLVNIHNLSQICCLFADRVLHNSPDHINMQDSDSIDVLPTAANAA